MRRWTDLDAEDGEAWVDVVLVCGDNAARKRSKNRVTDSGTLTAVFPHVTTETRGWDALGLPGEAWDIAIGDCMPTHPNARTAERNLKDALLLLRRFDPSLTRAA